MLRTKGSLLNDARFPLGWGGVASTAGGAVVVTSSPLTVDPPSMDWSFSSVMASVGTLCTYVMYLKPQARVALSALSLPTESIDSLEVWRRLPQVRTINCTRVHGQQKPVCTKYIRYLSACTYILNQARQG